MRRWGPLLTSPSPYQSGDHSDAPPTPQGQSQFPPETLYPTGSQEGRGRPGWGVPVGLSMGRGLSAGSVLPINTQVSWTPSVSPRHISLLPGAPTETHPKRSGDSISSPQETYPETRPLYSSVCRIKRLPILAPAWAQAPPVSGPNLTYFLPGMGLVPILQGCEG